MTPFSLNIRGKLIQYDEPAVMGILNITPDSFFGGSRTPGIDDMRRRAGQMIAEGASMIDIGGFSTRPGGDIVPESEEIRRVKEGISAVRQIDTEIPISVDTFRAAVAKAAVEEGADIINDISGGTFDPAMLDTVAAMHTPYILMHLRGTIATMHAPQTYGDTAAEVLEEMSRQIALAHQAGIADVIADPGFGFSKNLEQNYAVFAALDQFAALGCPLLVGISRKSMLTRLLGITPDQALEATVALNTEALVRGAAILRVHDVRPAVQAIKIHQAIHATTND